MRRGAYLPGNFVADSDSTVTVLMALLGAGEGGYVSGEELAERLGVSRVSVWGRLKKLQADGFELEAVRGRGYRLVKEPAALHPVMLEACLRLRHPRGGPAVIFLPETDSTNEEAGRALAAGRSAPFVIFAGRQTAGRGRLGRAWHSAEAGGLYVSFGFQPRLPPARMPKFTLWMGLSLGRLLNETYALPVRVKWPNDLVHEGRKLAGMLTEARIDADVMRDLIFGLGLNVNGDPAKWKGAAAARVAGTLQQVNSGRALSIHAVAADVAWTGAQAYEAFVSGRFAAEFDELWARYDSLRGREVAVTMADGVLRGKAAGLDANGALRLTLPDGSRRVVQSGDVTLGGYGSKA
jgi:BirA family biotin operon repressor/biotin-[acetyl-CoA-carboxylase] ligase